MGKSKYDLEYTCRECGNKYSRLQDLDVHYSETHERRRDEIPCNYCDYRSTRKHDVARHTASRHPEKDRSKETETKGKKNEGSHKRSVPTSSTKMNPPKVQRTESEWPTLETLLGSPHQDLNMGKTAATKPQSSSLPLPETPYVTPRKRQVPSAEKRTQDPQPEEPRNTDDTPDPENTSNSGQTEEAPDDVTPREPDAERQTVNASSNIGEGRLVRRTTTTVNPDGSVKVVVEKFLES